ncbi:MAG TPA: hypothetical protein VGY99_02405 [Candidatus Binataceae bacterium]|nr:hypothetical protein [Candidatus Binataceae bacterium]
MDPDTDKRVLVTDFTNPTQGQTMGFIDDLALDHFGKILISPEGAEFTSGSALFQVNPQTGQRKLVSDFSNQAQGVFALFNSFKGLAGTSGRILANACFGPSCESGLLRIDPETGNRTVLSDFGGTFLAGLGIEKSGDIIVCLSPPDSLYRVNPRTGGSASFSDSSNPAQGPPFSNGVVYLAVVTPAQACHGNGRNDCLP